MKELKSKHPLYNTWYNMIRRCHNESQTNYHKYGKVGITVCDEWRDFFTFIKDMGPKPSPQHSIDRIDGKKGYFKENCRWANQNEQSQNRTWKRKHLYKGELLTTREISKITGIHLNTINVKIYRGHDISNGIVLWGRKNKQKEI